LQLELQKPKRKHLALATHALSRAVWRDFHGCGKIANVPLAIGFGREFEKNRPFGRIGK
jgi:hypothetical protein